ncbi:30S ribosomal protein S16 [Anaplasma phagocytophilum]|uniref:Small ribosomal subunit protein bS16 n=8 Tax=Anaplasma phagocytophilum TaxID=948 RepID=RS16_ANAPZ|nr:30S ribosomal protein S16 [Anaplasma phagocytophilum]Q2GLR4.1 RecName: Full=Small ribosomal subunit protein bS16; AltName: Full=30S ribosomal protein S16 [Anaplasma phagocytophilum str. HZ]KJZ99483.1 ribosomal protein S16 [Anaplasma phagocytophilum str. CR1007]ABD43391.1 ribosomal protein S16 [Anaplasma phagocytophilum str. HZ]AGR78571.1 30S ribosomal protein S16 [Anaplasma phagocytophilum str. HZ2]AGR79818.1 30S ribosomal protein S16 [Anaplasma phagocytophilum str. JM]AGR81074.1 30S ribos
MSVKIRLMRLGAKKKPFYRIVVADSRVQRDGKCIEQIGFYNPMVECGAPGFLKVNAERLGYWLGVGAQPTDRVSWFIKKGFIEAQSGSAASTAQEA